MASKPGAVGAPALSMTREKLQQMLQQGQIRIQAPQQGQIRLATVPQAGLAGQQPKYIRIVNSAAATGTLATLATAGTTTPIKVLSSSQAGLATLASPHTATRTIKIGSPKPPMLVTAAPQRSLVVTAPQASLATTSSPAPSPQAAPDLLGSRPGKREMDFESFSDSKRRKTDKGGKGLRHFSMKVCEKVKAKGTTSYNEVADELVAELTDPRCQSPSDQQYDQKNIRRRVYDALNVLMAMSIISKEKKEIRWLGLPTNSVQEASTLEMEKAKRIERIKAKTEQIQDLILQQIAFKKLVERNKEAERQSRRPTPNSVIEIPFIIVSTSNKTEIECGISADKKEYLFDFDNTFEIHDDMFVLKKMNMAMGLETPGGGQVSEEDLRRARGMVPRALEPYVTQLAHHGPGSYSMPKVTTPRVSAVKEDPELFAGSLDQDDDDDEEDAE